MFFTIFYMYATLLQWWRLGALKNKLSGTLHSQNALLLCDENVVQETKKLKSFENLLFRHDERVGCTVVPKQKINLSQWVTFPKDHRYFPIYFRSHRGKIESPNIYILVQAMLESYIKHSAEILQVENFGELIAWKANDNFEAILKTDIDKLTQLVHCYSKHELDINHDLKILRIETVDIEGTPTKIRYDKKFSMDSTLKYSHAPVHWRKFVETLKGIYSKISHSNTPKITIENGATKAEDVKKVPVSEVKPIKKDSKKSEDKNMLDVGASDYRRHKGSDHKRDKSSGEKHKTDKEISKVTDQHKASKTDKEARSKEGESKRDAKDDRERSKDHHHHRRVTKEEEAKKDTTQTSHGAEEAQKEGKEAKETVKLKEHHTKEKDYPRREARSDKKESKKVPKDPLNQEKVKNEGKDGKENGKMKDRKQVASKPAKVKSDLEQPSSSSAKPESNKHIGKRTTSSEKKLTKGVAVCDEVDGGMKTGTGADVNLETKANGSVGLEVKRRVSQSNGSVVNKSKGAKPPNILVYADSLVAKDSVKAVLSSILNKEKYTIYDLPLNQTTWSSSTVLVVVCGTVPPNLTFHLLQYLVSGGQLLCLCSDLLYSVLHTFTTAEVREHELVRFSYGKWKQVKMMHHIFCYQASPAKKQFSKDSDHSNQSSNGSSPVAPRTPSAVEIQHNGKDYVIQVQVLGTEETWQTPSLLLATVKGNEGRAIFSQVHLEINPNEYEDDENKFEALKDSDQARMEILKDILSNHLDVDCTSGADVTFCPAYFLGRHDLKLKLFSDCDNIKENQLTCEKVTVKFFGKDAQPEPATSNFVPVLVHSCPSNFSTVNYFETLGTEHIGRLVLYCDVLTSSQFILSKKLTHGIVIISRQQTQGVGRSNNTWLSPIGSANFSVQLHLPLNSPLGKVLPLVQQLVMVGIVSALKNLPGCQDLAIGIKWPNDLYANGNIKIGGLLVNSSVNADLAVLNIGCGINLDNPNPTLCVNDLIRQSNLNNGTSMKLISYEAYFAVVFNEIEKIINIVQKGDMDYLYDLYYKYWLHNNSDITIASKDGESKKVKIAGIDDFGFLRVRSEEGEILTVHPDGNTFDMLKGLISPKDF